MHLSPKPRGFIPHRGVPSAWALKLPTGPYLETQRATEASKSPQIPSCDRRRCLRSCQGTWRLCPGPPSAATRGTNGPWAPPSRRLRSRRCLRRGGRIGAQVLKRRPPYHGTRCSHLSPDLARNLPGSEGESREAVAPWRQARKKPDGRKQNRQQRGRRASLPGSWGMAWQGAESTFPGAAPPGPRARTPHLLRLAPAHSPGGENSRVPGSAAGGNCEPSCS